MRRELLFLAVGLLMGISLTLAIGSVAGQEQAGTYAISGVGDVAYIMDSRTGDLWLRNEAVVVYLGSLDEPVFGPARRAKSQLNQEQQAQELSGVWTELRF